MLCKEVIAIAISDSYSTVAEYKAAIGRAESWATDAARDATILLNLTGISRYIERKLGRCFNKDAASVARLYMRDQLKDPTLLWVDDLAATPTSIIIDSGNDGAFGETALVAADYELWPLNAAYGPEARPWDRIKATPWGAKVEWPHSVRVQVTAQWGWPAVPQAIKDATIQLAALLRLETPRATRQIPEMGNAIESSREAQDIIKSLLAAYGKMTLL